MGVSPLVTGEPSDLASADGVVLPGVGSGPAAMAALDQRRLTEPLREYLASGRPFLGVCLGLQLLLDRTQEGGATCLGVIPGGVKRLPAGLKVPHMGWNTVRFTASHPVLEGIPQDSHFYFVHSYYAAPADSGGSNWNHGLRRPLLQRVRPGQPDGNPIPPGEKRRDRSANLPQFRGAGRAKQVPPLPAVDHRPLDVRSPPESQCAEA